MSYVRPRPLNTVSRADLCSQASLASAERLFSDLGRLEGRQRQSSLSSTLEMTETIRVYVQMHLKDNILPQSGRLHSQAASFKQIVTKIASNISKKQFTLYALQHDYS